MCTTRCWLLIVRGGRQLPKAVLVSRIKTRVQAAALSLDFVARFRLVFRFVQPGNLEKCILSASYVLYMQNTMKMWKPPEIT